MAFSIHRFQALAECFPHLFFISYPGRIYRSARKILEGHEQKHMWTAGPSHYGCCGDAFLGCSSGFGWNGGGIVSPRWHVPQVTVFISGVASGSLMVDMYF